MKSLSLKLPEDLDSKLTAAAMRIRSSKSEVVRQALDAYLGQIGAAGQGTLLDLAGDVIGSLEGPGDLSHNRDHMRDFGQ